MVRVAALFVRKDSIYKTLPGVDCYDAERDARTFPGGMPVVAHPPCRLWGRLRRFSTAPESEKALAVWAVGQVRKHGGVLEHPQCSTLWQRMAIPLPSCGCDLRGGYSIMVDQWQWGHRARKRTWLYIVGCPHDELPQMPLRLGEADAVIRFDKRRPDGTHIRKGDPDWKPRLSPKENEATPPAFAEWLVDVARRCVCGE